PHATRDPPAAPARSHPRSVDGECPTTGWNFSDGFPLGAWLTGLRRQARRGTVPQAPLLTAIDPWWNPPWPLTWQRRYGSVRTHTRSEGPLDPTTGSTDLPPHTRRWLHTQLAHYDQLAPAQQDLLSDVGTADSAKAAHPHPDTEHRTQESKLALAHAYAAEHGHLHIPPAIQYHGFTLGQWLQQQRAQARSHERRTGSPWPTSRHLAAIDPWWNPPWTMQWERHHRAARAHALAGSHLDPTQGFPGIPDALGDWLYRQCTGYQRLHPRQQELLTDLGITAEQAALVRRRRSPRTLAFETGLAHARTYAAEHGHLAAPGTAVHDGYPVGR
ncbi:helicase associated domain-containing protein, partial [Kitasatospora aureofaciens]|uniref:helicase associated domain-containing protein n=1 Tax=Kitasatospora aureofaciens TaxID=1894 RepID=UPI0033E1D73F